MSCDFSLCMRSFINHHTPLCSSSTAAYAPRNDVIGVLNDSWNRCLVTFQWRKCWRQWHWRRVDNIIVVSIPRQWSVTENNFEKFEVNDVPSIQYPAVVYGHFSILIWGHNQWNCGLGTRSIPKCPNSLPSTIKLAYNSRVYSIPPPNLIFCVWRVSNRTLFYPKFSPKSIQMVGQAKES